MEALIALALKAIESLLPVLESALPATLQPTITFIENIIPNIASYGPGILASVQNIIAALQGSGVVTADQVAQLDAAATEMEAALDAQARKDGLKGVPDAP